jgi:hypothetical protein
VLQLCCTELVQKRSFYTLQMNKSSNCPKCANCTIEWNLGPRSPLQTVFRIIGAQSSINHTTDGTRVLDPEFLAWLTGHVLSTLH